MIICSTKKSKKSPKYPAVEDFASFEKNLVLPGSLREFFKMSNVEMRLLASHPIPSFPTSLRSISQSWLVLMNTPQFPSLTFFRPVFLTL